MLVIKLSGAAVFVGALAAGAGYLFSQPSLYYAAVGLSGAALLTVILSAFPWRRRRPRYP